jgi:peptidyl-prolyl cis-trans isomerase C
MGDGANSGGFLRALTREPLTHFFVAGLLVFLISAWRGESIDPASRTITIDAAQVARLGAEWEQNWGRAPSPREIDALIRENIKAEIYYREALRLGLDEDDAVIRRRLRSKMEYLAAAQVESMRPTDAMLQVWLAKYPDRFVPDAEYSFDQIYLGTGGNRDVVSILKKLSAGADWTKQGEAISLPKSLANAPRSEVEKQFGPEFANAMAGAAKGRWSGPLMSGFGLHLVRLRNVVLPSKPKLAEVQQAVENDWRAATYKAREAKAYETLLRGYTIRIAKP